MVVWPLMVRLERTKTTFILGAGASVHCHVPVMKDFLDEAYRLRRYTSVGLNNRAAFDLVFEATTALSAVFAKSQLELRNIESVFAAFEMAALFGRLGELPEDKIPALVPALKDVILETIEVTQEFRNDVQGRILPSLEYQLFAHLVSQLATAGHDVTVITFNYDVGVDFALQQLISYASALGEDPENVHVDLLKLHGSVNWAQCNKCEKVTIKELGNASPLGMIERDKDIARLRPSRLIGSIHCQGAEREQPFIVPPTWNKHEHYAAIAPVWRRAAQRLGQAENIFIIGYSLPQTDQFFRYLYALGTMGPSRIQRFHVFNPDGTVDERYQQLLGPIARERYRLNPDSAQGLVVGTFNSAVHFLKKELLPGQN